MPATTGRYYAISKIILNQRWFRLLLTGNYYYKFYKVTCTPPKCCKGKPVGCVQFTDLPCSARLNMTCTLARIRAVRLPDGKILVVTFNFKVYEKSKSKNRLFSGRIYGERVRRRNRYVYAREYEYCHRGQQPACCSIRNAGRFTELLSNS